MKIINGLIISFATLGAVLFAGCTSVCEEEYNKGFPEGFTKENYRNTSVAISMPKPIALDPDSTPLPANIGAPFFMRSLEGCVENSKRFEVIRFAPQGSDRQARPDLILEVDTIINRSVMQLGTYYGIGYDIRIEFSCNDGGVVSDAIKTHSKQGAKYKINPRTGKPMIRGNAEAELITKAIEECFEQAMTELKKRYPVGGNIEKIEVIDSQARLILDRGVEHGVRKDEIFLVFFQEKDGIERKVATATAEPGRRRSILTLKYWGDDVFALDVIRKIKAGSQEPTPYLHAVSKGFGADR